MIKKDLEDINKLKQSAFYETSKYTYMYPQTQSILDSIRNFEIEPKTDRQSVGEFEAISPLTLQKDDFNHFAQRRATEEEPPVKYLMKKYQNDLKYVVETY